MNKNEIIFNTISIILAILLLISFVAFSDIIPGATIGAATLGIVLGMDVFILAQDLYEAQNKDKDNDEDDSEDDN